METLEDVHAWLAATAITEIEVRGQWSPAQTLAHCAQSVNYLIDGFPEQRNIIVRRVFGPIVARRFLAKGAVSHDIADPIPGAPSLTDDSTVAKQSLLDAIERYQSHGGALHEHFAYGKVSKTQGDRLNVLHLRDHLVE